MPDNFDPEDLQEDPPVPDEEAADDRHLYEMKEGQEREKDEPTEQIEPPPILDDMEDMQDAIEVEEPIDKPPIVTPVPEVPEQPQHGPGEAPESTATTTVRDMETMGEAATIESGPDSASQIVEDMAEARRAAELDVGRTPTQEEQVRGSKPLRDLDLFEFDTGTFEANQGGMGFVQAESSYREVNFHWQRLMTAMIIDHQHRLEQLLAMLERER